MLASNDYHEFKFTEPPGYDRSVCPRCDICGHYPGEHNTHPDVLEVLVPILSRILLDRN